MDATSLSKWLHGSVAKQETKVVFFGEDAEFDGFSSLMADFQSIKVMRYSFPLKEQCELFVMCLS